MTEAKQKLDLAPPQGLPALLREPLMGCLLLAVATLLVYWPVQSCEYLSLDDPLFITRNPYVQAPFSFHGLLQALTARTGGIWQPVTTLTYLLDAALFGRDPTGPHIINLLWHVAGSLMLFLWLRNLTGAHWRSLTVAALFALHPLHVETVAWVAERKDVVSTCFGLLALWAYTRYASGARPRPSAGLEPPAASTEPTSSRQAWRYYVLALLGFALGLLSKPMLVTLPCLFLLLDFWPLKRFGCESRPRAQALRPLLREKIPFFLLSGLSCWLTVWAQSEGGAIQPLSHLPLFLRFENALVAYARYLGKLVWPADLVLPYPAAPHWPWATVAYAAALVAGLSVLALWLARRLPAVLAGWLWFLGTLVPVIGLVQVGEQSLADRYTYLPYIGLFLALSWGVGALLAQRPALRTAGAVVAVALVGACAVLTRGQLRYWQSSETLFTHTLTVAENNWLACWALGNYLAEKERPAEAVVQYQRALQLQSDSAPVLNSLGNAWVDLGRYTDAIQCFEAALYLKPDRIEFRSNLGAALDKGGRTDEALVQYRQVLQHGPHALTYYRLGNALTKLGRTDEAIAQYRLALQYQPYNPQTLNNLAVALFNQGKFAEALEHFSAALTQMPDDPNTRCNLANALAAQQRWDAAAEQYAEAARLKPELVDAHYGLARMLLQLGRQDDAVAQLQEVLRLNPAHTAARKQLDALAPTNP